MGLFDGLMGNASEVDLPKLQQELGPLLVPNERLETAFRILRDLLVFTDKRLLLIDKDGMVGSKAEYLSIPYRSIVRFSVETAGTFDMESELKLWLSGTAEPIQKPFKRGADILGIQRVLAAGILR